MTYKEKLAAFENGELNEKESSEIENDIDKFEALLDYFDSSRTPAALNEDNSVNGFSGEINRAVNKKVTSMILRTVLTILLFAFLFVFGLSTNRIAQIFGGSSLTEWILQGIYSLAFIPTVVYMMYRMLVKKEKAPAIILLVWNIVPTLLTFIISSIIGDAFAVFLPAYYGFSVLPSTASALFSGSVLEGVGSVFGICGMLFSVVISIVALALRKKNKEYKEISVKKALAALCIFLAAGTALFTAGTVKEINAGSFPDTKICATKTAEEICKNGENIFNSDILGKTINEADGQYAAAGLKKSVVVNNGVKYLRYTAKSSNIAELEIPDDDSGTVNYVTYTSGYTCKYLYMSIEQIKDIPEQYKGKTEKEVMKELMSFRFLPCYASFRIENGKNIAEYHYVTDIPASEYNFRFFSNVDITFVDGVMKTATVK